MSKTLKNFLTPLIIVTVLFGGYSYLSKITRSQAAESGLSSSLNTTASQSTGNIPDAKIAEDTAFLQTLSSLTKIKIDTAIFSSKAFTSLKDNEVIIDPVQPGRANPFSIIDSNTTVDIIKTSQVVTNSPSQTTATSATLNGTINNVTSTYSTGYFEYGVGDALDKSTTASLVTLVGTFNSKLTGLLPKTQYSFRAASKIGGLTIYGDVMTFNTN